MRLQLHEASQRSAQTQALAALEAAPKKAHTAHAHTHPHIAKHLSLPPSYPY